MQKMMEQMMELAKLTEGHEQLAELAGNWSYVVRFWVDPSQPPNESKGTATRKAIMDGRFFTVETTGEMEMPGAGGKMQKFKFKGMALEGYDNVKKKFWHTWIDNMVTGIMVMEGEYDPATKTYTYSGVMEGLPGMKQQIREVVKVVDKNKHVFEMFEDRGGQQIRTMEIIYTRRK